MQRNRTKQNVLTYSQDLCGDFITFLSLKFFRTTATNTVVYIRNQQEVNEKCNNKARYSNSQELVMHSHLGGIAGLI